MGLGENIREGRRRRGLTQAEVAERLDVTSAAVTQWERGTTTPRYDKLEQLARVLHMTVPELLGSVEVSPDGTTRPVAASRPVPLVATAHMGAFDPDEGAERTVQVPEEIVARHPAAYLVHGFGPCMNRRYPEDSLLLVDPERTPRNGDAVYVRGELGGLVRASPSALGRQRPPTAWGRRNMQRPALLDGGRGAGERCIPWGMRDA